MLITLFGSGRKEFTPISQNEDCESNSPEYPRDLTSSRRARYYTVPLFLVSVLVSAIFGAWIGNRHSTSFKSLCTKDVSQWSPLMPDVDITYEVVQFNGSLFKNNVYRIDGGPEVDAAWEALGVDYRAAIVPTSLAAKSGLRQGQVQVSPKYGGGFPANVEGLHHLHCLNLLRKSLYYNIDYYRDLGEGPFKNDDRVLKYHISTSFFLFNCPGAHISRPYECPTPDLRSIIRTRIDIAAAHCLDILRQQLMCTVDVAVLGQIWWNKDEPTAFPDFNTEHKCRNFENVRRWAEGHQAPKEVPPDYLMRPRPEAVYETIP